MDTEEDKNQAPTPAPAATKKAPEAPKKAPEASTSRAPAKSPQVNKERPAPGEPRGKGPASQAAPQTTEKKDKVPPVYLMDTARWQTVNKNIQGKGIETERARFTNRGVAIHPKSVSDFRKLTAFFRAEEEQFFTYTLEEERPLRVVIRGIPGGISEDEVTQDLTDQGFTPSSVKRMISRRDGKPLPLLLVQLPRDQDQATTKITRCCGLVVKAELQRAPTDPTQCHRCQRFGHGQSRCTATPRCVKCAGDHHSGDCQKPREEKAKCVNCNGDHPASYRGCPNHPKNTPRQRAEPRGTAAQAPAAPHRATTTVPRATTNVPRATSYAAAARRGTPPQPTPNVDVAAMTEVIRELPKLVELLPLLRQLSAAFGK